MRRRWIITLLLTPLLLALVALAVYRCHTVPLSQCSEVYQRYHDTPGIRASFIRDMPINDSITLDVTLLQADDSLAFVRLLQSWNRHPENHVIEEGDTEQSRSIYSCPKGHPELKPDIENKDNNEMVAIFYLKYSVVIFHTENDAQLDKFFGDVIFGDFVL